jgi:hypothetical protein
MQGLSLRGKHVFDPYDAPTIRREVEWLIREVERLTDRLRSGRTSFGTVSEEYRDRYQPVARGLVQAMLHHVPDDDPRIHVTSRLGSQRTFTSLDITAVEKPLREDMAVSDLENVVAKLRRLLRYLPA